MTTTPAEDLAPQGFRDWMTPHVPTGAHLEPGTPTAPTVATGETVEAADLETFLPRGDADPLDPDHFLRLTAVIPQPSGLAAWLADDPAVIEARSKVDAALAAVDAAEAEAVEYVTAYSSSLADREAAMTRRITDPTVTLPPVPAEHDTRAEAEVHARRVRLRVDEYGDAVRRHDSLVRIFLVKARPEILAAFRRNVEHAARLAAEAEAAVAIDADLAGLLDAIDGPRVAGRRETLLGRTTGWQIRATVRRSGQPQAIGQTLRNAVTHPDLLRFWDLPEAEPKPVVAAAPAPAAPRSRTRKHPGEMLPGETA